MEVIEHKCPGCGANLKFDDGATTCQCEYCKRKFTINKEENTEPNDIDYNYILKEQQRKRITTASHAILLVFLAPFILTVGFFFLSIIVGIFGWIITLIIGTPLISDLDSLDNSDYSDLDWNSEELIESKSKGIHDFEFDNDSFQRENTFLVTKKGDKKENILIPIYKINYESYENGNNYTLFVPIKYENVKMWDWGSDKYNGKISAPKYCLVKDYQCTYGYTNYDEAYNSVVKPLKEDSKQYKVEAEN